MKVIIPVAGAGTKLRPLTYTQPKALIPVAGKRILDFIIDQLLEVGVTEFVFVVGYLGEKIKDHVDAKYPNIKADYAVQAERLGVGHAIWTAKEYIDQNEETLIVLGDTIVRADLQQFIKSETSVLGVRKVDDPRDFGVVDINAENDITSVVEKPKFPKSNMALVGLYKIKETKDLFSALDKLMAEGEMKEGEEIQLTNAIMMMIDQGIHFKSFRVDNWYDCGKMEILLETNAKLLKGTVNIPDPLMLQNSVVIQPVNIAKGTLLKNSIVGPNVTIGENVIVNNSIVSNSILGDFTNLNQVVLSFSIIGSDTSITGFKQSLNIGDNTAIDFSSR